MNLNSQEIGKKIKRHRKGKITQKELAEKIGKTESSIRKYEKGLVTIPLDVLEQIAVVLGVTVFELMDGDKDTVVVDDRNTVSERIRRIRKEKGWTQAQFAEILSVSQQMIGQFENSKKPPKLETIQKIAAALGVTAFDLMEGECLDKKTPGITEKIKSNHNMTVGERIRHLRKERGLTQKKLGELCKIAEPTIRRYEAGSLNPKLETIEKIASALGVPAYELTGTDYWDKKYPDIAQKSKEHEGFVDYLNALGYIVQDVQPDCVELIKDGASVVLEDHEFSQLIESTKDMIAWELWRKAKKNKPLPAKRKTT